MANLYPKIWGPNMWESLHTITFGYPDNPTKQDKENYKAFFTLLASVLPCSACQVSYGKFINTPGPTHLTDKVMESRESLTKWLYEIHKTVNKKLDVRYNITYDDLIKKYESYRIVCDPNDPLCVPQIQISRSFQVANKKECPLVHPKLAMCFADYAKKRGVIIGHLDQIINNKKEKNDEWEQRNIECARIAKDMKLNAIPSIELSGKYKGLPTVPELQLISQLCTTMRRDELIEIAKSLGYEVVCPR